VFVGNSWLSERKAGSDGSSDDRAFRPITSVTGSNTAVL